MASGTPPMAPPAQPAPGAAPPKKGTSPLVWILAGCGGIIVIVLCVFLIGGYFLAHKAKGYVDLAKKNPALAAAKVAVALNPDLEIVSEDDASSTLTIRNKKTGEEITMNAEDIKKGRLKFKNEKGEEVTFEGSTAEGKEGFRVKTEKGSISVGGGESEEPPAWVPTYPDSKALASSREKGEEGIKGTYSFQTGDAAADVLAFFEKRLKGAGFSVERAGMGGMTTLNAKSRDGRQKVNVVVLGASEGQTHVTVEYEESGAAG